MKGAYLNKQAILSTFTLKKMLIQRFPRQPVTLTA